MSCPIKLNSTTTELTVHTYCYCDSDLLCVERLGNTGIARQGKGREKNGDLTQLHFLPPLFHFSHFWSSHCQKNVSIFVLLFFVKVDLSNFCFIIHPLV